MYDLFLHSMQNTSQMGDYCKENGNILICSSDKLNTLWNHILDLNTPGKSEEQGDIGLGEFALILETFFSLYIRLTKTLKENEATQQSLRSELASLKKTLQHKEDELICHQAATCGRCTELEQEVADYKRRLTQNESRIKSIANILNLQNYSQASEEVGDGSEKAVSRAFDLVSQMLLDPPRTRQRIFTCGQKQEQDKNLQSETLAPETMGIVQDPLIKNGIVPETLCVDEHENNLSQTDKETLKCVSALQLTPKKQVLCHNKGKTRKSPVLGNMSKRVTSKTLRSGKSLTSLHGEDIVTDEQNNDKSKTPTMNSLSLLKDTFKTTDKDNYGNSQLDAHPIHSLPRELERNTSEIKLVQRRSEKRETDTYKLPYRVSDKSETDYHQSKPSHTESKSLKVIDEIFKPPLSKLEILKTDQSPLRGSDNNAISYKLSPKNSHRPSPSQLSVDANMSNILRNSQTKSLNQAKRKRADYWQLKTTCNLDTDVVPLTTDGSRRKLKQTQLALGCFAKQRDVCTLEEFNGGIRLTSTQVPCKRSKVPDIDMLEEELLGQAMWESLQGKENREADMAVVEKDEDIIMESPNSAESGDRTHKRLLLSRKASESVVQSNSCGKLQDVNETHFSPLAPETLCPEALPHALAEPDCSFDRLSEKTSPDFKYCRNAVRKKEERKKLEGWDCDQCRKYYEAAGVSKAEMKKHMDRCSRHRDKYKRPTTPPGFWDAEFPNTQECCVRKLDVTQFDSQRARLKVKTEKDDL